jgi:hypothetical protein
LFQAPQNDETNSRINEAIFLKQETTRKQTLDTILLDQTRRGSNEKASNDFWIGGNSSGRCRCHRRSRHHAIDGNFGPSSYRAGRDYAQRTAGRRK